MSIMSDYRATLKKLKKEEEEQTVTPSSFNGSGSEWSSFMADYRNELDRLQKEKAETATKNPSVLFAGGATKRGEEDDSLLDLFQKGAFDEGVNAKTISQAILGTAGDVAYHTLLKAPAQMGEGIGDWLMLRAADASEAMGNKDWADNVRNNTTMDLTQMILGGMDLYLDRYSVLGSTSESVAEGVGQYLALGGIGKALGALGVGAKAISGVTSSVMGISGAGSAEAEAIKDGATQLEALKHGLNSGAADAISEMLFGGFGKGANILGFNKGLLDADDLLAKSLSKKAKNQIAKNLIEFGVKAGAEGLEEVIAGVAQAYSKHNTYMSEEEFWDILKDENLLEQFMVGALASGVGQVPSLHIANSTKSDLITGYNQDEQAVVEKLLEREIAKREEGGKALTKKEKSALEVEIAQKMEKGYLDVEAVESVLGGKEYETFATERQKFYDSDTYKSWRENVERTDKLQKDIEELGKKKPNETTMMEQVQFQEMRTEFAQRRADRTEQKKILDQEVKRISAMRNQMRTNVKQRVSGTRLAETYAEFERKKQKYKVDVNKYQNENARKTVQNILDSGLGDNTKQFHEKVDLLAKISEDKGVTFGLTSNDRLRGTRHYKEGFTTHGFVNANGDIMLNKDSDRILEVTVGHEVTHVLEKANAYKELSRVVRDFAIHKEGLAAYNARLAEAEVAYKGQKNTTPEAEITADLIGQYIFTDADFINSLSIKNRNVFEWIRDEIKYMWRVATAGSEEKRELERVKRLFDQAWQENIKGNEARAKDKVNKMAEGVYQKMSEEQAKIDKIAEDVRKEMDDSDFHYSLTPVEAVQPTTSGWMTGANTDEVRAAHPTLYAVDEDATETRNPTQVKNTVSSYRKVYSFLQGEGFDGKILDASSGLGLGTQAGKEEFGFDVEDIEPYPDKDYNPKYTDYSALDEKYDAIISNAVLNVIPQDQRDALVVKMGEMLNPGGRMFINVRGKDVLNSSGKIAINEANMEYFIPRTAKTGSYQKGFTTAELKAYLEDALGAEFEVTDGRKVFGTSSPSAIVTKKDDVKYSYSSIANSFFGKDMTTDEFFEEDYHQTEGYQEYVEECLNNLRQSHQNLDDDLARASIQNSIDGIVRVAVAAKKAGYDIVDSKEKRNLRDSKKRLLFSSLEPNSDYITSHDISTICDKRKNFAEIYDEIVRLEESKKVPKGKRFFDNVDNYFAIHDIMAKKGLTTPCRQCYVESMRKNLAPMARAFLDLVQETDPMNVSNPQLWAKAKADATDFVVGPDGKKYAEKVSNKDKREFVLSVIDEYGMSVNDLTIEKLTTAEGLAQLRLQAPMVYEAFNSFYGQAKPKMPKQATPFRFGELTALLTDNNGKINQNLVKRINSTGGFRLQSYSDFQIQNYVDVLQVLFEAGTLGLNGHAYTKVPAFLDATEGTNLKRNISIFMYKDGNEWKLDRNDSFPYSLEEIYDIVNNDKTGNTSIIAVSQNAEMSAWIMANDNVGYGIPFHKSGLKMGTVRDTIVREGGREIKGYKGTIDHTKQQSEVWKSDQKKVKNGIDIYSFWDFSNKEGLSKTELIEKNLKAYIDKCDELGYLPKFRAYVMNNGKVLNDVLKFSKELGYVSQDATVEDISFKYKGYTIPYGYYKFLGDFGMFTPDGKAAPQQMLSLDNYDFAKAEKFFADATGLRRTEILQQFANGEIRTKLAESNLTTEELESLVAKKRDEVAREAVKYSMTKATDKDYLDAVNRGDMKTAQQMVEQSAKDSGYTEKVYHGTTGFGFTKIDLGMSDDGISFFATDSLETARTYSGQNGVKEIKSEQDEVGFEEIENAYDDTVNDFISLVNRTAGFYNFMDYDDSEFKWFKTQLVEGTATYDDVQELLDDRIEEIVHNLYENALYDNRELMADEFYESEEVNAIYEASGKLYHILKGIAEWTPSGTGNYQLLANTEGLFEIDADGNNWNRIPFQSTSGEYLVNTRRLAQYAKAEGYKGVKITNVFDDGGRSIHYQREPATVYIFFDPQSQVKSADPVTYDENGQVIPLTERFNPKNDDIRYSMTKEEKAKMDEDYFAAIESGDEEVQNHLVREFAKASMPDSKLVDENGNLRVVYHGTNTGDFTVFNPDYIGMSSGDDGFFGMGFYFAYSKGEASYYGARRIIPAYLNLTNPFDFQKELHTYNGKRARYGHAPDAVALMNFADKFPDIAMHITMGAIKNGESSGKRISVFEFAKAFKDVIENKEFDYQEMQNDWGEKETLVTADPQVHEYEYDGEIRSWRDFGFQKRFSYGADILDVAYEYLSNAVYSYIDIPRFTSVILDNNREFTAELKNRGYDGTIQSEHGDEAVAFYPNQIKSAESITRDADGNVIPLSERFNPENDDLRYSISKKNNELGDGYIPSRDIGYHDEFEDFAPIREDVNTTNTEPVLEEEEDDRKPSERRREKSKGYTDFWADLIGDTSTWVDLPLGLSYKTRTLRRILRKVVRDANGKPDIQKADAIYDALETKYDHNEARLKQESAKLKGIFKELNLNHAEDTYAHMLGELRHNPETTLTPDVVKEYLDAHKDKIDEKKVDKAIHDARMTFDQLIVRVNKVLREQGFQEIPYRNGYFPHFTNPKQNWLHKALNWKPIDNEIPTSIAGLTEMFKPSRSWQSFNKRRMGDTTDYSLYQGLDTYIHGALDWIYHIEDLQQRRSLENLIRYTHSEEGVKKRIEEIQNGDYDADEAQNMINAVLEEANNPLGGLVRELMNRTNTLANKKSSMDRAVEDLTSRKVYSVMTNLNNRITANQVVGSLSSALTNFIPMVQSWHQVSPVYTVRGMADYIRSVVKDDGMMEKSDFLTNRLMEEEKLYQTGWDKVSDKAAFMMNVVDSITSNTVWRSKYLQNLSEGMSERAAIKDADQFAKNLMGGRSRGNAPTIFDAKNPLVKIFTAFQLEVANQYGYMFDDVIKDSKSKTRLVKGYATAFLGAYAYNALYSSLVGRDAAFDPISIIEDLLKGLFDDEEEKEDVLLDFGKDVLEEVPFVGGLMGGGRIPMSSAFPYSGYSNPVESALSDINDGKFSKEWLKPLYYLAMPVAGGQVKKTIEGLGMFSDDHPVAGSYTASGRLRFPVEDTLGNRVQAAMFGQYANKNARDYFDEGRSALTDKQLAEYMEFDAPIQEYWEYRDGLKGLDSVGEKADYINSLDLPISTKNMLINNQTDRKTPIDLTGYDEYDDFEEFDWATKNPDAYDILQDIGVSYKEYKNADKETKDDYEWAYKYPHYYTLSKSVTSDVLEYRKYYKDLKAIKSTDDYGNEYDTSVKTRRTEYINNLDIDYGAKLVLFKSFYKADDSYDAEIFEYIKDKNDLTFEEKLSILKTLGFGVSDDGTVTWD